MERIYTEPDIRRRATNLGLLVGVATAPVSTAIMVGMGADLGVALMMAAVLFAPSAGLVAYLLSAVYRRLFCRIETARSGASSPVSAPAQVSVTLAEPAKVPPDGGPWGKVVSVAVTIAGIAALLVAGAIGEGVAQIVGWAMWPSHEERLARAVAVINEGAPVMVDMETRLDSARVGPGSKSLVYNYTLVTLRGQDVGQAGARALREYVTANTCRNLVKQKDLARVQISRDRWRDHRFICRVSDGLWVSSGHAEGQNVTPCYQKRAQTCALFSSCPDAPCWPHSYLTGVTFPAETGGIPVTAPPLLVGLATGRAVSVASP